MPPPTNRPEDPPRNARKRGRFITWIDETGEPVLRIERLGYAVIGAWAALVLGSVLWFDASGGAIEPAERDLATEPDPANSPTAGGAASRSPGSGEAALAVRNGSSSPDEGPRGAGTPRDGNSSQVMEAASNDTAPTGPLPIEGSENERIRAIREIVKRTGYPDWRTHAPKLVETLKRDPSLNVRLTAIRALALAEPGLGGPAAIRRLEDRSIEEVEAEALLLLVGNARTRGGSELALVYAHHEKSRLRAAAIQVLYSIEAARAIPELSRAAWSDPDRAVQALAIRLLKGMDDPAARQTLSELERATDDPALRRLIVE